MIISLIACCKLKSNKKTIAEKMYISSLFKLSLRWAKQNSDKVLILSAKYYLLELDDIIEPYNETLLGKNDSYKEEWSKIVYKKLIEKGFNNQQLIYVCGDSYRKYLMKWLPGIDPFINIKAPGVLGQRMQWLKNHIKTNNTLLED